MGRRIAKTVNATTTTLYAYDGWNVVEEYEGGTGVSPVLAKIHTWGLDLSGTAQGAGGVGGLLYTEDLATNTTWHHHYDGILLRKAYGGQDGNVTHLTNATAQTVATYTYDAFGNTVTANGSAAATNKYRFSTKPIDEHIAATPLYYYGYRFYNALTGRWINRDPIEEKGGLNLYGFVGNDGLNQWDNYGLASCLTDLLDLINDPEGFIQDKLFENLAKRFPALKIVELWTELMQEIIKEVNANLTDLKKQINKSGMSSEKMCCVEKYLNDYDRSLTDLDGKNESDKELLREAMEECECYGKKGGMHPLRTTFFWDVSGMVKGIGDGAKNFVIEEMVDNIQDAINDGIGKKYPDVPFRELISFILEQYVAALGEDVKCTVGSCSESEK
jgi:RHS repeat-associated protein